MKIFMIAWVVNMIFMCIPNSWMATTPGPIVKGDVVKALIGVIYLAVNSLAAFQALRLFLRWLAL